MRLPKIFDHDIITDGLILLPNPMFWLDFTAKSLISTALKILLPQTPNFAKPHFWIFSPIWQSFSPVPIKFLKSPQEFTHYFGPIRAHLVCSPNTSCIWLPVSVSVCFTETYMYHWFLPPPMVMDFLTSTSCGQTWQEVLAQYCYWKVKNFLILIYLVLLLACYPRATEGWFPLEHSMRPIKIEWGISQSSNYSQLLKMVMEVGLGAWLECIGPSIWATVLNSKEMAKNSNIF